MKTTFALCCLLLCVLGLAPVRAALIETHNFNALNLDIPDGNPSGLANVQNFVTGIGTILDVEVRLHIIPTPDGNPLAFAGDLYAYVVHSSGIAILLNRVGKALASPFGYDDNGFDILLDDEAVNGDVHVYRNVTTPAPGGSLSGSWQPDARLADPNLVLDTTPRTPGAMLTTFTTLDASGDWTLFIADLSTGAEHRLSDWSLIITGNVPEPAAALLLTLGSILLASPRRRSRAR